MQHRDRRPARMYRGGLAVVLLVQFALVHSAAAQPPQGVKIPPNPLGNPVQLKNDFWERTIYSQEAAAVQLVGGAVDPFLAIFLRVGGKQNLVWGLELRAAPKVDPRFAPPLDRRLFPLIRDDVPFAKPGEKPPDLVTRSERADVELYAQALVNAFDALIQKKNWFAESAAVNKDLKMDKLLFKPREHRGKVVTIRGKLIRLLEKEPPRAARQQRLFRSLYEGWVLVDGYDDKFPAVSVMFIEKPEGAKLGKKLDQPIEFHGYFLKRWRHEGKDGNHYRRLHFVAPTFTLLAEETDPVATLSNQIISGGIVIFLMFIATVLVLILVNVWYRRDDARVHRRLAALRSEQSALEDDGKEAAATAPVLPPPIAERIQGDELAEWKNRIEFPRDASANGN